MKTKNSHSRTERVAGLTHFSATAGNSLGGLQRLWQETAFRHIVLALPVCLALLACVGADFTDYCVMLVLFFCLVAVEALNAALECIVDHLAPHREEFARDAKYLGSLATMALLCANGVYLGAILYRAVALS